jgi:hypothetical protein
MKGRGLFPVEGGFGVYRVLHIFGRALTAVPIIIFVLNTFATAIPTAIPTTIPSSAATTAAGSAGLMLFRMGGHDGQVDWWFV